MREASVESLCRRLAETPPAFLRPVESGEGLLQVEAIIADLFRDRSTRTPSVQELDIFQRPTARNRKKRRLRARHLRAALIASWLLHDEAFGQLPADHLMGFLTTRMEALSTLVMPGAFLEDEERREELVRLSLQAFEVAPAGESKADAEDRLSALDSVRRAELMAAARKRQEKLEKDKRRKELEELRRQEKARKRQAARHSFED